MFQKKPNPDLEYFTIYDTKSSSYREPMLAINQHVMLRQISNLLADPAQSKNELLTNAEDFQLFRVGTYDRKTGQITGTGHEHIANFHELKSAVLSTGH